MTTKSKIVLDEIYYIGVVNYYGEICFVRSDDLCWIMLDSYDGSSIKEISKLQFDTMKTLKRDIESWETSKSDNKERNELFNLAFKKTENEIVNGG